MVIFVSKLSFSDVWTYPLKLLVKDRVRSKCAGVVICVNLTAFLSSNLLSVQVFTEYCIRIQSGGAIPIVVPYASELVCIYLAEVFIRVTDNHTHSYRARF